MENPNFEEMTIADLAQWFNEHCEQFHLNPVKRFASKEAAVERCKEVYGLLEEEKPTKNKKPKRSKEETKELQSAATKKTWKNEEVAAARKARTGCLAYKKEDTEKGGSGKMIFPSVYAAFDHYDLPKGKHIAFRKKLKAEDFHKPIEFLGLLWENIPYSEVQEAIREAKKAEATDDASK